MQNIFAILIMLNCVFLNAGMSTQISIIQKIEEIVQGEEQYNLFSGTVLLAQNGKVFYANGVGEANKEYQIPNRLETRINISSIQKCFVAVLIMQLHQEGKALLTDP